MIEPDSRYLSLLDYLCRKINGLTMKWGFFIIMLFVWSNCFSQETIEDSSHVEIVYDTVYTDPDTIKKVQTITIHESLPLYFSGGISISPQLYFVKTDISDDSRVGLSPAIEAKLIYNNWMLQTGMSYSHIKENKQFTWHDSLLNTGIRPIIDTIANYTKIVNGQREIIYVTRPSQEEYDYYTYSGDTINVENKYTYLELPVLLGYNYETGDIQLEAKIGFVSRFLWRGQSVCYQVNELERTKTDNTSSLNSIEFDAFIGIGAYYYFYKNFTMGANLYYRPNVASVSKTENAPSVSVNTLGISFGLYYNF